MRTKAKQLKRLRWAAGMTQVALAKASGVSQQMISDVESGVSQPSPATLKAIADVLGCSPLDLLDDAEVAS
mgnify:CR=1 FL=1